MRRFVGWSGEDTAGKSCPARYSHHITIYVVTPGDVMYYVKPTEGAYHHVGADGYYRDADAVHTPGTTHGAIDAP